MESEASESANKNVPKVLTQSSEIANTETSQHSESARLHSLDFYTSCGKSTEKYTLFLSVLRNEYRGSFA